MHGWFHSSDTVIPFPFLILLLGDHLEVVYTWAVGYREQLEFTKVKQ
jgi:hypothetical protein